MNVRDRTDQDSDWICKLLVERRGSTVMVVHGEPVDAASLPALIGGDAQGLATYRVIGGEAELVSLDVVRPGQGVGTLLVETLISRMHQQGISRIWVTTTNDNLTALRFYQRRGFRLCRLRPGAVDQSRLIKPSIPQVGDNGIPIRDELDLCRETCAPARHAI